VVARVLVAVLVIAARLPAEVDAQTKAGSLVQLLLPVSALTAALVQQDHEGARQFVYSFLGSALTVEALKRGTSKTRPDLTNRRSFPSAHTSAAFASAGFINRRYGGPWGKVAIAGALWVSYSRLHADRHFVGDVLAGGSIGLLFNWAFVTPIELGPRVRLIPEVHGGYYGLSLTLGDFGTRGEIDTGFKPHYRFEFAAGPMSHRSHTLAAPTPIDLVDFRREPDPAASGIFTFFLGRHEIGLGLVPIEFSEFDAFQVPTTFRGATFPANTLTRIRYRMIDYRVRYAYNLTPDSSWRVKVGLAVSVRDLSVTVKGSGLVAKLDDVTVLPLFYLHVSYEVSRRVAIGFETHAIALGDDHSFDADVFMRYRITRHWDIGIAYRVIDAEANGAGYRDSYTIHGVMLLFGYQW